MANTLTGLLPVIYEALDIVSRELVGFIPAVSIDASADMVAKDQTLRIPVVPAVASSTAITPGLYAPDSGDQTISYVDMSISKAQMVPVRWSGVEQKGLSSGKNFAQIQRDRFAQAMRTLVNEVELDLATAAYQGASRAYGTAASTPFASSLADAAQIKKILDDNGAPADGRSLIINSTAGVNLRSLANIMSANVAGTDRTLRQGVLLPIVGLDVRESAQIVSHTKGAGTGYVIVAAGELAGQTTISLDGGTVNTTGIKAGDIVTFGTGGGSGTGTDYDTKYVVNTGLTATSGDIVIGNPGLKVARVNDDVMTIGGSYTANVAFHKQAIQLLIRTPEMPLEGDAAEDVTYVTDPITGLTFQIAMYKQYKQVHYEVGLAWGVKAIKSEHIAILLG